MRLLSLVAFVLLTNSFSLTITGDVSSLTYDTKCATCVINNSNYDAQVFNCVSGYLVGTKYKCTSTTGIAGSNTNTQVVGVSFKCGTVNYSTSKNIYTVPNCSGDYVCPTGTKGTYPNCYCDRDNQFQVSSNLTCSIGSSQITWSCPAGSKTTYSYTTNTRKGPGLYVVNGGSTFYCGKDGSLCPDNMLEGATAFMLSSSCDVPTCTASADDQGKEYYLKINCTPISSSSSSNSQSSSSATSSNSNVEQGQKGSNDLPDSSDESTSDRDYTAILLAQLRNLDSIKWDQRYGNSQNNEQTTELKKQSNSLDAINQRLDALRQNQPNKSWYEYALGYLSKLVQSESDVNESIKRFADSTGQSMRSQGLSINQLRDSLAVWHNQSITVDTSSSQIIDTSYSNAFDSSEFDTSYKSLDNIDTIDDKTKIDDLKKSLRGHLDSIYSKVNVLPQNASCSCSDTFIKPTLPILGKLDPSEYFCSVAFWGFSIYDFLQNLFYLSTLIICVLFALRSF